MMPRTLDAWLAHQTRLHPQGIALGLERVAEVWRRLGHPPWSCPIVTVGGTNGKGSCTAMLEAMAESAGYRTATYTSPHLLRYNERVRLGGEPRSDADLCAAFAAVEAAREEIALTYFEFGTLAAFDLFARHRPDLLILEVGLGGRLDAVNVLDPEVAIVTSIGLDHTAWLGDTLDAIAHEKAGIFRPGRPAIIGQRDAPARLDREAERLGARPLRLGREFDHGPAETGWLWRGPDGERLALPLPRLRGPFQLDNASAAIMALRSLRPRCPIPVAALRLGLERAWLAGRFQVIPGPVTWILDVAHNGEAAQALASNLAAWKRGGRLHAVLAVLADKDARALAAPLQPWIDTWFLSQSEDPRALPAGELADRLGPLLAPAPLQCHPRLADALTAARQAARPGDGILAVGSFTTVATALRFLAPSD